MNIARYTPHPVEYVRGYKHTFNFTAHLEALPGYIELVSVKNPFRNYHICVIVSDMDLAVNATSMSAPSSGSPTIHHTHCMGDVTDGVSVWNEGQLRMGIPAATLLRLEAGAGVTISRDLCQQYRYYCINITEGNGSSYTEANFDNNIKCWNMSAYRNCLGMYNDNGLHCKPILKSLVKIVMV